MPGRNDPCPCGSGKKYKKCCLTKDLDKAHDENKANQFQLAVAALDRPKVEIPQTVPPPAPKTVEPPDPHTAALNARWNEFQEADEEGSREVFLKTLDEPELMDDEMAFEMLNSLHQIASESGELARFAELIELLRVRLPEIYSTSRKFYVQWRIEMAMTGYQTERLLEFTREMAETAGEDVDIYRRVVDQLAYHGELAALSEASHIAWPLIKTSREILWGQSDYAAWGADCAIFERLQSSPTLDGRDPQLIEQARFYIDDLQLEEFEKYVARLSGSATRTWSLKDFEFKTKRRSKRNRRDEWDDEVDETDSDDPGTEALAHLLDEFVGYARRQEGIPYTKSALVIKNIYRYLIERHKGELEPRQSMFDAMMNPNQKPKAKPRPIDHPLCPDRDTFDRYFGAMLDMMAMRYYDVAATFELMPTWMRFLEARGLIESSRREATLADIAGLQPTLLKLFSTYRDLAALAENLRAWPENAAKPTEISVNS